MAYGFNNETVAESTNSKQFNAGITANVTLESITFESPRKDGTGDKVLIFTFRGPEGEVYRHIEWDVQDGDEKKLENMAKRIKHILTKFIPEEQAVLHGNTYEEFANGVIKLLNKNNVGKSVAIKLVYNDKNNLQFTKYLGFIAKEAKDLSISKTEKVTKVTAAPTDMDAVSGTDDLPF